MKEITRVFTAQITQIATVEDDVAEDFAAMKDTKKVLSNFVKNAIDADDVVVKNVKTFVREVDE